MQILYQYFKYLSNYSERTKETYYTNVLLYIRYLKDTKGKDDIITICNINKGDIYNYIAYMDKFSKNTKAIRIKSIKNFYNWLGLNLRNFLFEDIKLYNFNKKMPLVLSSQQANRLINYYSDKRNKLIIYLFLTTEIRLAECESIMIENIDLENRIIKINGKGNKERIVYINSRLVMMLKDYIDHKGKLFKITRNDIRYIVKKAMIDLGFKGSVHTLRHTAGTLMYQKTNDILLVKEFLGHKSIEATQIYTHIINNEVKEAVNKNPLANYKVGE